MESYRSMANYSRVGETGLSEAGQMPLSYAPAMIHAPTQATAPTNLFSDSDGSAAYFGELEEALKHMQGVGFSNNNLDAKSCFAATAAGHRPPTLEIFPSWPMRFQQAPCRGNCSLSTTESTDSGYSPVSEQQQCSEKQQQQQLFHHQQHRQEIRVMPGEEALNIATEANDHQHKTSEKRKVGVSISRKDGRPLDDKTLRRLAQNREAARKSRLRKKAYVQQLETSRIKLAQLEQDLQRARSQGGVFASSNDANISSGAAMFDMEYARWIEENYKHMSELRNGLQSHLGDSDLRVIVDECLFHYDEIFRLKGAAARADVFHLITGMWTTPAERCFLWIGGFRPSELLKILIPQLDPLTDQQLVGICNLRQSSQQAEEALSQGLEQLQSSLADTIANGSFDACSTTVDIGNYMGHMAVALQKLASLEGFIKQADNLRQETLHQLRRVLTVRQAARCFLAIGEYNNRLRTLSSYWASRPQENINLITGEENAFPTTTDLQIIHQPAPHSHIASF